MHKISYESMLGLSLRKKTAQQSTLNFGLSKYRKLGTDICGFLDSNEDIETIRTFPT